MNSSINQEQEYEQARVRVRLTWPRPQPGSLKITWLQTLPEEFLLQLHARPVGDPGSVRWHKASWEQIEDSLIKWVIENPQLI